MIGCTDLDLKSCRIGVVGIGWGSWMACYGAVLTFLTLPCNVPSSMWVHEIPFFTVDCNPTEVQSTWGVSLPVPCMVLSWLRCYLQPASLAKATYLMIFSGKRTHGSLFFLFKIQQYLAWSPDFVRICTCRCWIVPDSIISYEPKTSGGS